MRLSVYLPLTMALCIAGVYTSGQTTLKERNGALLNEFYRCTGTNIFWHNADEQSLQQVQNVLDSLAYWGISPAHINVPSRADIASLTSAGNPAIDLRISSFVIDVMRSVYEGCGINAYVRNDEVSEKFTAKTDSAISASLRLLAKMRDLPAALRALEPNDKGYYMLKDGLRSALSTKNDRDTKMLTASLNLYKWIYHFRLEKYVVVNIPAAQLTAFGSGSPAKQMTVIVGKARSKTPRFSSWCNKVILYPYWNVPAEIAQNELLPLFRRNPALVAQMNMQIIDKNGKVADARMLNWQAFSKRNFPYSIRQCTGCDNALGVIKFNLTDPFDVYIHDTNNKLAFVSTNLYLSHGCIRVSEPIELGNFILDSPLDSNFLSACYKHQQPVTIDIPRPVPVFVVYMPVVPGPDGLVYYKDVYQLFR